MSHLPYMCQNCISFSHLQKIAVASQALLSSVAAYHLSTSAVACISASKSYMATRADPRNGFALKQWKTWTTAARGCTKI